MCSLSLGRAAGRDDPETLRDLEDEVGVRPAFEARAGAQASASPVQPGAVASAPKRLVLKVHPEKVVSWDHRKLGGRY